MYSNEKPNTWMNFKSESDRSEVETTDRPISVVTEEALDKHNQLLPKQPYRQHTGVGFKGISSYQTPDMSSPIWPIDSAYRTVPVSIDASHYPEKRQNCCNKNSRQI